MEAEHPLQRFGAVAGRRLTAAAELPLAQADLGRDRLGPRGRVPQQDRGPGHGPVGGAVGDQPAGDGEDPVGRLPGRASASSRRAAGGSRSASGTRWLAISLSGVFSTWPPADGRNLMPTMTVPGLIIGRAGPVSGPAT